MDDSLLEGAKNARIQTLRARFRIVLKYVVFCYDNLKLSNSYSRSEWLPTSKHNRFEDYLKIRLVDDYLRKESFKNSFVSSSIIKNISFSKETTEEYKDISAKTGDNKNDIYVQITQLRMYGKNSWLYDDTAQRGEIIDTKSAWFQIECKILSNISSKKGNQCDDYIEDIFKFLDREYKIEWMPFGGQIAFVENGEIENMLDEINVRLAKKFHIDTHQNLQFFPLTTQFPFSYQSIHAHRLDFPFDIYHLFLDYRAIIKD